MKKDNRKCICCGLTYKYCNSCVEYAHLPQWKNIYDKVECKVIFDVVTDYVANAITKEEAKEKLIGYDIKGITVKESVAKVINEILGVNGSKITNTEKKEEKVKDVENKETSEKHSFVKNGKKE